MKKVLVLGSGGREHAICHTLSKSKNVEKIYAISGNGGIALTKKCECVDMDINDLDSIINFLNNNDIYITIVSTDDCLASGYVDKLTEKGFRVFGPTKKASKIEWSKAYAKQLMQKYNIPTASFEVFTDYLKATDYIKKQKFPLVLKADGLALGKGVLICSSLEEAENAIKSLMQDKKFGNSGEKVVIEQFVKGYEVTILAFTDGKTLVPMVTTKDYKRALDGDKGLNTGGMGTISPHPYFEPLLNKAYNEIFIKTLDALNSENIKYKGVIYFDLMVDNDNFNVIEYNARFGDPEAQVVLPRLKTDLFSIFDAIIDERLDEIKIEWDNMPRVCVMACSKGYPNSYEKGKQIVINNDIDKETLIFHSGTKLVDSKLFTNGGRVLGVVASGDNLKNARENAYKEIEKIYFDGIFYRKEIGEL